MEKMKNVVVHMVTLCSTVSKRRRLVAVGGALLAVAVVAASLSIWDYRHQIDLARADCVAVSQQYASFERESSRLPAADNVKPAVSISRDQVADASTIDVLHTRITAFTAAEKKVAACTGGAADLHSAAASFRSALKVRRSDAAGVVSAARAVVSSRDAKTLADAKASLVVASRDARGVLDSSADKVADNTTRDALSRAVQAADALIASKGVKDPAKYRAAQAALSAPVKAVNDSEAVKTASDKAAQAAAAAQAAQAQAPQSGSSSVGAQSSGSSSNSYSRSSGSSPQSGSSSAHSSGTGTTTNSAAAQGSSSADFGSSQALDNSQQGLTTRCKVFGEQAACDALTGQ